MTSRAAEGTQAATETPVTARPLSYRPNFVAHMTNAAAGLGAEITWRSADYIATVRCGRQTTMIVGYHFPLNNAAACALADDKSATADTLAWHEVPHIRHTLIRFADGESGSDASLAGQVDRVADLCGFPMVIKPHRGTGGRGVTRVNSREAMVATLNCLRMQYEALAASPWIDIISEHRVVVLDGHALLIFEKVRAAPDGEWRNNLKYGSVPVIQADQGTSDPLTSLALRAASALGLRFASVDVVASREGLAVLEVNSGVCLERFSAFGADHFDRARSVYARALGACL